MTIDALPLDEVKLEIPIKGIPTHHGDLHLANHKKLILFRNLLMNENGRLKIQQKRKCH
jgi:hypothetical protein